MVPLDADAAEHVRAWLGEPRGPGQLNLHQALADHRPGLWGDDARVPRSVLLVRERGGRLEVFGAGDPGPAVGWLSRKEGMTVALMAPRDWWDTVEQRVEAVERVEMQTLSVRVAAFKPVTSTVVMRRLTAEDSEVFVSSEVAVDWALSGWETFHDLVERGAGYLVPAGARCAAAAWVYSQAGRYEAIGVSTAARFRRLGLGKAVASALVSEILHERGRIPLWTTAPGNAASWATARSLGFSVVATETYLRWRRPGPGPGSGPGLGPLDLVDLT